jgi:integrase
MKHANFSVKRIESFRCKPGKRQSFYWDGYAPGLGVRITAAGTKSYIFETSLHGRSIRITIGDLRTWTLGKAQEEATRLKTLTDQGIDPRRLKKEQKAAAEAARLKKENEQVIFGKVWSEYIAARCSEWGHRHLLHHTQFVSPGGEKKKRGKSLTTPGVLYSLVAKRLAEINALALVDWIKEESKTRKNTTRQAFVLLCTFWKCCTDEKSPYRSIIDVGAVEDKMVLQKVPAANTKRDDVFQRAQMKPWFAAVRGLSNKPASAYLQGLVLTGARREELGELKWKHVDFEWNSMWIKDKIENVGRKIPLTPYLASLLNALPRRNEWVFSSPRSKTGRIVEPISTHRRALKAAKLPHVTIHGLRRTFKSLAEWVEMPTGITAQIMGHKPSATAEKHYIYRPLELLAVWHNKYEAWILEQAEVPFGEPKTAEKPDEKPLVTIGPPRLRLVGNG